jgi:hypothetical protein
MRTNTRSTKKYPIVANKIKVKNLRVFNNAASLLLTVTDAFVQENAHI